MYELQDFSLTYGDSIYLATFEGIARKILLRLRLAFADSKEFWF